MKTVLVFVFVNLSLSAYCQGFRSITLSLDSAGSFYFENSSYYEPICARAFQIASAVFNSPEFQSQIQAMDFDCEGNCNGCNAIQTVNGRISGNEVLNKLFSQPKVSIAIDLEQSGNALGETTPGTNKTTAYFENIRDNMKEFNSITYALATNLCHEYMHQVGFCHTYCTQLWPVCPNRKKLRELDNLPDSKFINNDVTYKVGWTAFYILLNWQSNNIDPVSKQTMIR